MERPAFTLADYGLMLTSSLFISFLTITLVVRKIVRFPYSEFIIPPLIILGSIVWFASSKAHRTKSLARKYCLLFGIYLLLIGAPRLLLVLRPAWRLFAVLSTLELTSYVPLVLGLALVLSTRFALMDLKEILILLLVLLAILFLLFDVIVEKAAPPFQKERTILDIPSILLLHISLNSLCLALSTVGSLTLPKAFHIRQWGSWKNFFLQEICIRSI